MGLCSSFQRKCSLHSLFLSHSFFPSAYSLILMGMNGNIFNENIFKYFMKPLQIISAAEVNCKYNDYIV